MSNPFTLDAIDTKEKLNEDKVLAGQFVNSLDSIIEKIDELGNVHDDKVDYDNSIEALKNVEINQNKLESEEVLLTERKKHTLSQIAVQEDKIEKYHESKNDIVYNKQIEEEIESLRNSIDDLDYQVDTIDKKIQTIHGEIQINATKKKTILETMKRVQDLETEHEAYKYYLDAIKR